MNANGNTFIRVIGLAAGLAGLIVIVFLAQLLNETKEELATLRAELKDTRHDAIERVRSDHFASLDKNCTWCHRDVRFLSFHGDEASKEALVNSMMAKAGVTLSDAELRQIHGAMDLLTCISCHDQLTIDKFNALSPEKQTQMFRSMTQMPGSGLKDADSTRINAALHAIQGF
jgi:hypothetical protein